MSYDPVQGVREFQTDFNQRYLLADRRNVPPGEFEPLMRPFRWWQVDHQFEGLEHVLRAATARVGAALALLLEAGAPKWETRGLLNAADFLGEYQSGAISVRPSRDPLEEIREAVYIALDHVPPEGSLLDDAPEEVLSFHTSFEGIVKPEVMALDDRAVLTALTDAVDAIRQTKNTTYNVVRTCGDRHLEFFEAQLGGLLPADQLYFLHGLDAFPKHEAVAALLRSFGQRSPHDAVREGAARYLARVEAGEETNGFEP